MNFNFFSNDVNQKQKQKQINKQLMKQKQDQKFSNENMARMLSSAEIYAIRHGCQTSPKYGFYDHFGDGYSKDINELKSELIFEIEIFKTSYKDFIRCSNNKEYKFPSNLNINSIIDDINIWINNIPQTDKKYYKAMVDILLGKKVKSFEQDLFELEKDCQNYGKMDVYDQMEIMPKVKNYVSCQASEVEKNFIERGDYDVKLNLGQKPENDEGLRSIKMGTREERSKFNNPNNIQKFM